MKLIVGLGNPGDKYKNNRHNVGFMFIDFISKLQDSSRLCSNNKIYSSSAAQWSREDSNVLIYPYTDNILLAKPQTYMNKSGTVVNKIITHYLYGQGSALSLLNNLIIVHDDLDIPLGKFRIDFARGPKLHNGISSIEANLKSKDFWRIRIGVDNRYPSIKMPGEDYVLQDFKAEEKIVLNEIFPQIFKHLQNNLLKNE